MCLWDSDMEEIERSSGKNYEIFLDGLIFFLRKTALPTIYKIENRSQPLRGRQT